MATFARRLVPHSSLAIAAADAAFKRIEAVLAKHPIVQS
jgi:hypothetical protein